MILKIYFLFNDGKGYLMFLTWGGQGFLEKLQGGPPILGFIALFHPPLTPSPPLCACLWLFQLDITMLQMNELKSVV
jgi:hypothetical protein